MPELDTSVPTWTSSLELKELVQSLNWVHQIDLGNGVVTPGRWPPHPLILQAFDAIDFTGKKVLDIGAWDGLWSFESEHRGAAEVFATDYITQRDYAEQPTFRLAHDALSSRVRYNPRISVFDIEQLGEFNFDIVIFCGVYYHLRNPLAAIAKLRRVTRDGGLIIIEGDAIFGTDRSCAEFFYDKWHYNDPSNWWVPSIPCLQNWLESSFFEVTNEFSFPRHESIGQRAKGLLKRLLTQDSRYISRSVMVAKAVSREDPNYIFPDDELRLFDLNHYGIA